MSGTEYLQSIKGELVAGRNQWRRGDKILAAFGYSRRRQTVLDIIKSEMAKLGLAADPPVDSNMPLDSAIRFSLADQTAGGNAATVSASAPPTSKPGELPKTTPDAVPSQGEETGVTPFSGFKVGDLESASKPVACVTPNDTIAKAYTEMSFRKYSQLVVASSSTPRIQDIKGIVSYQTITEALLNGKCSTVNQCLGKTPPVVTLDDDIDQVVSELSESNVVLVKKPDNRLCGIITAWDLANEFKNLVGPFKRIGEIEVLLRTLLETKVGVDNLKFPEPSPFFAGTKPEINKLTLGELLAIIQSPDCWEKLDLPFDRDSFCKGLDRIREHRNGLMHFRDELSLGELDEIRNLCDMVRKVAGKVSLN